MLVNRLYERLETIRLETRALRDNYAWQSDGTPGGRVQADIAYGHHNANLTALTVAEDRLCFGRLDTRRGDDEDGGDPGPTVRSMHIGRMGMFDDGPDGAQLLMDWRAPAARPFYLATAAHPLGVVRRRHLRIRRRLVESVSDEHFDRDPAVLAELGLAPADVPQDGVAGESALLDALNAPRTGRMGDIVETIQAEQDVIIRSERAGVLVVQGGPGTGKTAVALHRAAYLLYNFRDQLAQRGVLLIGPNRTFLEYIGQVLPSLGENAVVLSTLGDLFPGVSATAVDSDDVAVIKGRTSMAPVIANAVLDRQRVPRTDTTIDTDSGPVLVEAQVWQRAQSRAWATRLPHNRARAFFLKIVVNALARRVAAGHRRGLGAAVPLTEEDYAQFRLDLRTDEKLTAALAAYWPVLTPQQLLRDLFASAQKLRITAPGLSPAQRDRLVRPADSRWTTADVPLLDEAGELLGPPPTGSGAPAADPDQRGDDYAQDVLDMLGSDDDPDAAQVGIADDEGVLGMVTAADLAALHDDRFELTSTAERAAADREWTYGHVVVDEAQELSPMAWRMVVRKCPARSMTLVGDVAQTGSPSGARDWGRTLRPVVGEDWRLAELSVNYRTPAEIAGLADRVLARIDPRRTPPQSIRSSGSEPWWQRVDRGDLAGAAARAATSELGRHVEEQLGILVPRSLVEPVAAAVSAALAGRPEFAARTSVLTVGQAKGLEFDVVVLVDPDAIEAEHRNGVNDIYVALTRATQRLGVLYSGAVPAIHA